MHPSMLGSSPRPQATDSVVSARTRPVGQVAFSGIVIQGRRVSGPVLDHPTFNLVPRQAIVLRHGTYVATVRFGGLTAPATLYWGRRPTLEPAGPICCELHLLGGPVAAFDKAYDLEVMVLSMLRPDVRFPTLQALRRQLQVDREAALRQWHLATQPRPAASTACGTI